jgi:Family of unknown function (DUF6263)
MLRQAFLATAVLLAAVTAPVMGQEVELKWKFKEGDKFYVEDVTNMKEYVNLAGLEEQKVESKVTLVTSYAIKKVTSETVVAKMKMEHVAVKSEGKAASPLGKLLKKFKDAEFTVTLTHDGNIKSFEGFKEVAKAIAGDDKDQAELLKMFINEETFSRLVEDGFCCLPGKTVKKGDGWDRETKLPMPPFGEFKVNNAYVYGGKVDGKDVITVKQNMRYVPPPKGTKIMDLFTIVRSDMKAENAKGKYIFDSYTGRLVSFTMEQTFAGTLTLNLGGNEISLDLSVESIGTSKVYDKNPVDN